MPRLFSRRGFLRLGIAGALGFGSPGCGTILYPDRIGQPPGMLDWKVVALDTLGLLLFVVPGVIAFVVDFYNGTIYLPQGYYGSAQPIDREKQLVAVEVPRSELSRERVEQTVAKHVGRPVSLTGDECQTKELASLGEFWKAHDVLVQQAS
jgi:hypothetical protein